MHAGDELPLTAPGDADARGADRDDRKGFGCVGVVDADGRLLGIITDGDLRRAHGRPARPQRRRR